LIKAQSQSEDIMINDASSTMDTSRRVLIAGGGIAGLSLARALQGAGHEPLVIERSSEWPATNTAHYLPTNAIRALAHLGLGDAVAAAAHPIRRQRVTGTGGRILVDLPMSTIWGAESQCAAIRHDSLHELLLKATTDVPVRLGTTIEARLGDRAVKLSDGSVEHYDVLVGADGVDSVVRTAGIGGVEPTYADRWAWAFIADDWDSEDDTWHARLLAGRSLVTMPLGNGAVFCYADVASPKGRPTWDWREYFDDLDDSVTDLVAQAGHLAGSPIMEVDQPYAWLGSTVLIGDAAHAMSPSIAQGVALAVEDALVLAETLSDRPVYEALPAYEQRRAERTAWIRAQAHRRDSARGLTPALRDRVLRLTGRRMALAGQRALLATP
jgi:2-polyprenyl-6-methoxyphenol hydroxylase-like FAD-dependent oxidoreductase